MLVKFGIQKNFIPDRMERIISPIPSTQPPPTDSPVWAVKPQWRNGMSLEVICVKW